jgi:hypothetical protein
MCEEVATKLQRRLLIVGVTGKLKVFQLTINDILHGFSNCCHKVNKFSSFLNHKVIKSTMSSAKVRRFFMKHYTEFDHLSLCFFKCNARTFTRIITAVDMIVQAAACCTRIKATKRRKRVMALSF